MKRHQPVVQRLKRLFLDFTMIDRRLLFRLVLPLIGLAVLSVILAWPLRVVDVFTNLLIELVSILITVLYVDWILRARETEKWKHADLLIKFDFASWALSFIAEIQFFLNEGGWDSPEAEEFRRSAHQKHWGLVIENISVEEIHSALVKHVERNDVGTFVSTLEESIEGLARLTDIYAFRFSAEEMEAVLELQGTLRILSKYLSQLADEESMYSMANGDPVEVDKMKWEDVNRATPILHEAISRLLQMLQMFGNFGFPKGSR